MTILDFVVQLLAVFLGALAAFLFDDFRDYLADKKERNRVLRLIRREVNANKQAMFNLKEPEPQSPFAVPNARVPMRTIWQGLASKIGLLKDEDLLEALNVLYFQLDSLELMMNLFRQYSTQYQFAPDEEKRRTRSTLASLNLHWHTFLAGYPLPQADKVLKLIDAQLGRKTSAAS